MSSGLLVADGASGERLFAAIAAAKFTEAAVATSRLAAWLHPFPTEGRARLALSMAGGENVRSA